MPVRGRRLMKQLLALALVLVLLAGAVLSSGCTQQQASAQEIKIGVVASMTGPSSTTGKDIWQSAVVAADEINANGGVYVKDLNQKVPVRLIQGDDESTREGGQKAVTRMITEDKVDVLVGGFSSAVTSAHQSIVADNKVPYIITGASSPIITRRTDINTTYMFHHCPTTDDYGMQTVEFIDQQIRPAINAKFQYPADRPLRLAIIYQDSPYGKGVLDAVANTIASQHLNIQLVDNRSFKMGESDFRTILTGVKSSSPDAVYSAAFLNEQIPMITQARRDVGLNTIFLVVECNDDPDYYKGLGEFGAGSVIESRFGPYSNVQGTLSAPISSFKNNFSNKWGGFPGMMGASTYEGVYIATKAIEDAGTRDKVQVRETLDKLQMPQIIEYMEGQKVSFTDDYRESKFDLYMSQLAWNATSGELRPKIVWPDQIRETAFVIPDWYEPGHP
jgi:branched-chain amino acid transport system substrate-binding protein